MFVIEGIQPLDDFHTIKMLVLFVEQFIQLPATERVIIDLEDLAVALYYMLGRLARRRRKQTQSFLLCLLELLILCVVVDEAFVWFQDEEVSNSIIIIITIAVLQIM
jgi:hypothetical protein